ncbi:DUF2399 domain-containing protein [Mycobacterium haemophilum]
MTPLLTPELLWLWNAIAAGADRRGDTHMTSGQAVTVLAPNDPAARAAAAGVIHTTPRPGQRVRIRLDALATLVRRRGPYLTPGAVAAHATGRPLAQRAVHTQAQAQRARELRDALCAACDIEPELRGRGPDLFEHLRRTGWVTRLDAASDACKLVLQATSVAAIVLRIPEGRRYDRRLLVPADPHALDDGTPLSGLTLALLTATGTISPDQRATPRSAWAQVGVDCDEIMGGLAVLGIQPAGWTLPPAAICTLPPKELTNPTWPTAPHTNAWVFITENPSIIAAAANLVAREPDCAGRARLVCTLGNPSSTETTALAALGAAGWNIAVRADFDPVGIRNVTALLNSIPQAVPWRMTTADYIASAPTTLAKEPVPATPWEPELAEAINTLRRIAFEESLMGRLLDDLKRGFPPPSHDSPKER